MRSKSLARNANLSLPAGLLAFAALAAFAALLTVWNERRVEGEGRALDGDSLRVDGVEIRLVGIDAPELAQTCERDGQDWRCGQAARAALERLLRQGRAVCTGSEKDRYGRLLAVCTVNVTEVNAALVRAGMAVSFGKYRQEEVEARDARKGMWAGAFQAPADYRRDHPRP